MIKVTDVAYARFRAPDLDIMETFLMDFGLERSDRTETTLYMRACGPDHHVHITEVGDPAFIGMAFHAASEHVGASDSCHSRKAPQWSTTIGALS